MLEFPAMTTFVAAFNVQWHGIVNSAWLVWTGFLISIGETTDSATVKYLTKHMVYECYKFHIYFFLSVLNRRSKYTISLSKTRCTYVWRDKGVEAWGSEDRVAISFPRLWKSFSHAVVTSKSCCFLQNTSRKTHPNACKLDSRFVCCLFTLQRINETVAWKHTVWGKHVATGAFGGSFPTTTFCVPQFVLCPEKFVLNKQQKKFSLLTPYFPLQTLIAWIRA